MENKHSRSQFKFQFTFGKWIGPDPATMDYLIIILTLVHPHNTVTMQDTVAVQMSKVKKKYIYIYI